MSRYSQAISYNKEYPLFMNLNWIGLLDNNLSPNTKKYIEGGSLDLRVLAAVIKDAVLEAGDRTAEIDALLWNKLHDQDYVINWMQKMGVL